MRGWVGMGNPRTIAVRGRGESTHDLTLAEQLSCPSTYYRNRTSSNSYTWAARLRRMRSRSALRLASTRQLSEQYLPTRLKVPAGTTTV